jgi:nucleotide-binding universal stress UspA family protein
MVMLDIQTKLERHGKLLEMYPSEAESGSIVLATIGFVGFAVPILQLAETKGVDTIIIGSRGPHEVKEFLLGSTSYKVVHNAKCTVVIAK